MIPRVFHHIWIGSDFPEEAERLRETWRRHHPDWSFRLWTSTDLDWLENQALFDRATSNAQKADIARYEIIRRFGGVYLDADMECLRPIDPLLHEDIRFLAGRQPQGSIAIGVIGSTPAHPLLDQLVATLPSSCLVFSHAGIAAQTGPKFLTRVVEGFGWEGRPDIRIVPPSFFYPYDWTEPSRASETFRTAFAVHHWGHSWRGAEGVTATLGDLQPGDWDDLVIKATGLAQALKTRFVEASRTRIEQPSKARLKTLVRRAIPDVTPMVHALPWGSEHVLVATPFGTRLLLPVEDISLAPELALNGVYDQAFVDFLGRSLRPGMTFVDVGANVGLFTIIGAALVGAGGRIWAYECNPTLVECLGKSIQMNWFNDRIVLVPKAASRDEVPVTVWMSDRLAGLGSTVPGNALHSNNPDVEERIVEAEPLDDRLAEATHVDLLKIDVEGGEPAVLDGARKLLSTGKIGMVSLEFRTDALTEAAHTEMNQKLAEMEQLWNVTFHEPGNRRAIPLDEVLTRSHFPQLLCRFPNATIRPS